MITKKIAIIMQMLITISSWWRRLPLIIIKPEINEILQFVFFEKSKKTNLQICRQSTPSPKKTEKLKKSFKKKKKNPNYVKLVCCCCGCWKELTKPNRNWIFEKLMTNKNSWTKKSYQVVIIMIILFDYVVR